MTSEVEVKEGPAEPQSSEPKAPAAPLPPANQRGAFARILDWLWLRSAFAELSASKTLPSARTLELARRAHGSIELGRLALEPSQAFEHAPVDALACDLYAQAVYWALRAHLSLGSNDAGASNVSSLDAAWNAADRELLERAAGDGEALRGFESALIGRTFADFAELPADEQARLARSLRPFAEALLESIDGAQGKLERLWLKRFVRVALPVVGITAVVAGIWFGLERAEQARNVLHGKQWVATSRWPEGGCTSPAQECAGSPFFFFATGEEDNPTIEFDLGSPQTVSSFRIVNRKDCCPERAVPLVIEVSQDRNTWKEVARKTDEFQSWKGSFPTAQARFIRLRVPRRSFLHLSLVRFFR